MVICINLQDAIPGKQISFLVFDRFIRILLNFSMVITLVGVI